MDESLDRAKALKQVQSDVWMAETHLKSIRAKWAGKTVDNVVENEQGRVEAVRCLLGRVAWAIRDGMFATIILRSPEALYDRGPA